MAVIKLLDGRLVHGAQGTIVQDLELKAGQSSKIYYVNTPYPDDEKTVWARLFLEDTRTLTKGAVAGDVPVEVLIDGVLRDTIYINNQGEVAGPVTIDLSSVFTLGSHSIQLRNTGSLDVKIGSLNCRWFTWHNDLRFIEIIPFSFQAWMTAERIAKIEVAQQKSRADYNVTAKSTMPTLLDWGILHRCYGTIQSTPLTLAPGETKSWNIEFPFYAGEYSGWVDAINVGLWIFMENLRTTIAAATPGAMQVYIYVDGVGEEEAYGFMFSNQGNGCSYQEQLSWNITSKRRYKIVLKNNDAAMTIRMDSVKVEALFKR